MKTLIKKAFRLLAQLLVPPFPANTPGENDAAFIKADFDEFGPWVGSGMFLPWYGSEMFFLGR
jgi:hypothetical protein